MSSIPKWITWEGAPTLMSPIGAPVRTPIWLPCRRRWSGLDDASDVEEVSTRAPTGLEVGCGGFGQAFILGQPQRPQDVWPLVLLRPCEACQRQISVAREATARRQGLPWPPPPEQSVRARLYQDEQGYVRYKAPTDNREPWQRLGLPHDSEFRDYSIREWKDPARRKYLVIPTGPKGEKGPAIRRADRKPGVTYLYRGKVSREDPHADDAFRALEALQRVIDGKSRKSVLLAGNNGTGKSHLAFAAAQDMVAAGRRVKVFYEEAFSTRWTPTIIAAIRDDDRAAELSRMDAELESFKEPDILIWDELAFSPVPGARDALPASFVRAITGMIYARRRAGLITVWTTNATFEGLESRLGPAVISRIRGDCGDNVFWLGGRDWRIDQLRLNTG